MGDSVPPPMGLHPQMQLVLPNCEALNGQRCSETREEYAYRMYSCPAPPALSMHPVCDLHVPVHEDVESTVSVTEDGNSSLDKSSDNAGGELKNASSLASAEVCSREGPSLYKLGRAEKEAWIDRLLGRAEKEKTLCGMHSDLEASFTSTAASSAHFREGGSFCLEEEAGSDASELFREGPSYLLNDDAEFEDLESGSSCARLQEGPSFLLE